MPILLTDTLAAPSLAVPEPVQVPGSNFTTINGETRNTAGLTPLRVVQELPDGATEEQKDSAIQANFKAGAVAYNTHTDTMTSFGVRVLKMKPVSETRFMDTAYFHGGKYFRPELGVPNVGVAGDSLPYLMRNDNAVTSLLLGCFLLAIVAFSFSKGLILQQLKNFFYVPRSVAEMTETVVERRFQGFLILQTSLLLGIVYYVYQSMYLLADFSVTSPWVLIGVFTGTFAAYFAIKYWVCKFVNWVFFPRQNNEQWNRTWRFLTSSEGVLLFPLVLLVVYFDLSLTTAFAYTAAVIILVKILTFYKYFTIFFSQTSLFLQIILYFCALELMPAMTLWGVLEIIASYLKINY